MNRPTVVYRPSGIHFRTVDPEDAREAGVRLTPGLSLEQLDDLMRGAIAADDHAAARVVALAMIPFKMAWISLPAELRALELAAAAWESRCSRTQGRPWLRSFRDPHGARRCPGCRSCHARAEAD